MIKNIAGRHEMAVEEMEVECITLTELIRFYGSPFFIKVDIEWMDFVCLDSLISGPVEDRPEFISVEADNTGLLDKLEQIGYTRFKMVSQGYIEQQNTDTWKFDRGSSGRFGDDAPGEWMDKAQVRDLFINRNKDLWYDFHAKM